MLSTFRYNYLDYIEVSFTISLIGSRRLNVIYLGDSFSGRPTLLLYESPSGNQVDGLPLALHTNANYLAGVTVRAYW